MNQHTNPTVRIQEILYERREYSCLGCDTT